MNLWKNRKLVNHIAKELERDACRWPIRAPEQFEIWWNKDKFFGIRGRNKRRREAVVTLKALESFENKSG